MHLHRPTQTKSNFKTKWQMQLNSDRIYVLSYNYHLVRKSVCKYEQQTSGRISNMIFFLSSASFFSHFSICAFFVFSLRFVVVFDFKSIFIERHSLSNTILIRMPMHKLLPCKLSHNALGEPRRLDHLHTIDEK